MKISTADFRARDLASLLVRIRNVDRIQIDVVAEPEPDVLTTVLVLAEVCRRPRRLIINFPAELGPDKVSGLTWALIRPLVPADEGTIDVSTPSIVEIEPFASDGVVLLPPESLRLQSLETFRNGLSKYLRRAGLSIPSQLFGAIATVAFEAATNAEEHGSERADDDGMEVLRFLALIHQSSSRCLASTSEADEYLSRFSEAFAEPASGWLRLLVVDSGMGIAYPQHYCLSERSGWEQETRSVYDLDVAVEQEWIRRALNRQESTKGMFGHVVSNQTPAGLGTRIIRQRLGNARAFAAIRTGRSLAFWSYSKQSLPIPDSESLPTYEVTGPERPLYLGTVWDVLVPLSQQLELGL